MDKRATIIYMIMICIFLSATGCHKAVLIKHDEEKWWKKGQTWVKTDEYEKWIEVKEVKMDSVYGEMDQGLSGPPRKKVVVPLAKVEAVKRMKVDPVLSILGMAVLTGTVLGVVYIVSLSNLSQESL